MAESSEFKKDAWPEGWDEIEAEETRLLRRMTVPENLRHLLTLQQWVRGKL